LFYKKKLYLFYSYIETCIKRKVITTPSLILIRSHLQLIYIKLIIFNSYSHEVKERLKPCGNVEVQEQVDIQE